MQSALSQVCRVNSEFWAEHMLPASLLQILHIQSQYCVVVVVVVVVVVPSWYMFVYFMFMVPCIIIYYMKYPTDAAICSQFYSTARFTLHVSDILCLWFRAS